MKRLSKPGDIVSVNQRGASLWGLDGEVICYLSKPNKALLISIVDETALVLVSGLLGKLDVHAIYKEF